ncbi:MAG: LuxR C-terminal-related transcriptional regulator, partial [Desulfobacterales bacterium]
NGIRMVIQGDVYLSPAITGIVVAEYKDLLAKSPTGAQKKDASPILRTKLHRPILSFDVVPRSDLIARLDELRRRPLTLVSAAAGYGKSTMASMWLEAWDGPYAWLSLDEEENDLHEFVNHLLAAICAAFPDGCDTTRSLQRLPELPPISDLSRYLLNDLDEIGEPFILVLDDFHKIREKAVLDLMGALLTHPPLNQHLMLLTRRDLPLLTTNLRARDKVNEIGAEDLHFTVAETKVFLKNSLGLTLDRTTAAIIQDKLEGWPAGMRLMSQSLKHSGDLDRLLADLKGGFPMILDYLVSEVLSNEPPAMRRLMAATSILDRFCAPLCDALLELDAVSGATKMNGDEFIARLKKDNLFLIALDTEHRWFRYHHMFQKLLRDHLNQHWLPEQIAALHSRADVWFAQNDLIYKAKKHTLAVFKEGEHRTVPGATDHASPPPPSSASRIPNAAFPLSPSRASQPPIEPLTNREIDVLNLLDQRLSNKEIAEKLFISTTTVKGHLQNIYGKLNVSKRREAVEKAYTLGILRPDKG